MVLETRSGAPHRLAEPRILSAAGIATGYFALYAAAELIARVHEVEGVPVLLSNAGPALSIALVARFGLRWLPATAVAPCALAVIVSKTAPPPGLVLLRMAGEAFAAAAFFFSMRLLTVRGIDLGRHRSTAAFLAATMAAAAILAFARALEVAVGIGPPPITDAILWSRLFLAATVAIVSVAPLVLVHGLPADWLQRRPSLTIESVLQTVALFVILWEVYGRFANDEIHFFYLLFLPLAWIATRQAHRGVAPALAATFVAEVVSDWVVPHRDRSLVELQVRLLVLAVTSLLLAAMVSERWLSEARMLARQSELAHVQRLNVGWEMASALAHELNQPLTAAMNFNQAALRFLRASSPNITRATAVIEESIEQIEQAGDTTNGLRDFMRKGELRLASMDVAVAVEEALKLVSPEAYTAGVALEPGNLAGLPAVMADKTQIVQVLVNIVRNAVQAIAAADITAGRITIAGKSSSGHVEVIVADNGPGLDPVVGSRLFEPFVTTKPSGMGLGLAISKSILEAHQGRLSASSGTGGGAVFTITLPKAAEGAIG